jgi:DNA-binding transcriptional ArsR family regulator
MHRLGRAMADPTRSRIVLALLESPSYPAELARDLCLTRTNVSNHLTCLRGCGIVVAVPEGRRTRYEMADPRLTAALSALVDVALTVDEGFDCLPVDDENDCRDGAEAADCGDGCAESAA